MIYFKDIKIINDKVRYNQKLGLVYLPWFDKEVEVDIFELSGKTYYHPKKMIEGYHENPGVFLPVDRECFTYDDYLAYCKECDYVYRFLDLQTNRENAMIEELLNSIKYHDSDIADKCRIEKNKLFIDKYECVARCLYYLMKRESVGEYYEFYEINPHNDDRVLAEAWSYDHPIIIKDSNVDNVAKAIIETINKNNQ